MMCDDRTKLAFEKFDSKIYAKSGYKSRVLPAPGMESEASWAFGGE